jgi:hypothetical protein
MPMKTCFIRRLLVFLACAASLMPLLAADTKKAEPQPVEMKGKVVPLADLVAKTGSKLDADAASVSLVFVADDGKVYLLVKDGGARLFFKDKALLDRPTRVTGRMLPGSQILQVASANSIVKGELCEIYYWCDICSIKRGEKMVCECCGGPMELHEEPIKK